jgi:hypothetical protein
MTHKNPPKRAFFSIKLITDEQTLIHERSLGNKVSTSIELARAGMLPAQRVMEKKKRRSRFCRNAAGKPFNALFARWSASR